MFHPSFAALRRSIAQAFALLLILAAAGHVSPAQAQVDLRQVDAGNPGFYSGAITGTPVNVVGANPPVVGDQVWLKWHNPYNKGEFTVTVRVTSGVKIDGMQVRGPSLVEMFSPAFPVHVFSGVTKKGKQEIFIGPQFLTPGVSRFEVTITNRPYVAPPPPPAPVIVPANMCNPIPNVGMFGLSATPQVISRANISIGPGEMECYQFTVASVFAGGRPTILTINNLPPTGTKTITVINTNGPYPLGPLNTTAPSLYANMTLQPGTYYLVVVVGGNSVSRTNYAWSLR